METEAGHAFVNLQVGLGQALLHLQPGGHRGGGPARARRREKRLAARQTAEEARKVTQVENMKAASEEDNANSDTEVGASENVTEKKLLRSHKLMA